jgi:hypothetical protein
VFFEPVNEANNQPLRVAFRLRPLEHNTPVSAWLLGTEAVPPHPISVGNASAEVGTEKINIFTLDIKPTVEVQISTPVITPNGDGINETAEIAFVLTQFAADLEVEIDIFDLSGHQVRKIIAGARTAGAYREAWDGRGNGGTVVPPGTYICRLAVKADAKSIETTKLIGVAY